MKTKIRFSIAIFAIAALFTQTGMAQSAPLLPPDKNLPPREIPADFSHSPSNSPAATTMSIVVNTLDDSVVNDDMCSLREAIKAANENTAQGGCSSGGLDPDRITFAVSGTITLSAGELHASSSNMLIIDGDGVTVKISGGNSSRIFTVDPGANLFLLNLSIINGKATDGGAVYNSGYLHVENSTLSGNQATSSSGLGGAIYSSVTTVVVNSTISGNQAISGGGIYNTGSLYLSSATLTNNSASSLGGGIYSQDKRFYLKNTILAKNNATNGPDCFGNDVVSNRYNLIGRRNGCSIYPGTGDLIGIDPLLGPLQDNGGATFTHSLLPGSLAIDHGNPGGCQDFSNYLLGTDQRGFSRSGRCDIGAAEFQRAAAVGAFNIFVPSVQRGCSNVLFFDNFSTPAPAWKVGENNLVLYQFLNGEYRILAKTAPAWEASRSGYTYTDYVLEVDARNATGTFGYSGLLFEFKADWSQFYGFQVDTNGNYVIFRFDSDGSGGWISNGYSPSINKGTASNHLKLERFGNQIWAYANGELLTIFPDAGTVEPRYVGVFTIADPTPNVDSRYDNFTVESISCGASYSYPALVGQASGE